MKKVVIIGAGIAGLSAAIFLNEKGCDVEIYEKSSRIGGRVYSYFYKKENKFIDNGKHILAGWYESTLRLLKIINAETNFHFSDGLYIKYLEENGKIETLDFTKFPVPLNFIYGLFKTNIFNFKEKCSLLIAFSKIIKIKKNDDSNLEEYLSKLKQTDNLKKYFWEPFIISAFNSSPKNISLNIFANVIRKGLKQKKGSSLIIPKYDLYTSLILPIEKYLKKSEIKLFLKSELKEFVFEKDKVKSAIFSNNIIGKGNYYISAFPNPEIKYSDIIGIHYFLDEPLPDKFSEGEYYCLPESFIHWIFIESVNHISAIISNSSEVFTEEIYIEEIKKYIPEINVKRIKIINNKRATFIPDNEYQKTIINHQSQIKNLFYIGDSSQIAYPSTIESAINSSLNCTENLINFD